MNDRTILRYKGYSKTPFLWKKDAVYGIQQIEIDTSSASLNNDFTSLEIRLGKLVEEFVYQELRCIKNINWICDHLQIQDGTQTLGELDALCYLNETPMHLEVVYKFYLYDTLETYDDPLAYWIGPNRKDTLLYKLDKLRHKQFPLLYNAVTKSYLDAYNLDIKSIIQNVCFKAQLFMPLGIDHTNISPLNSECISGFYLPFKRMDELKGLLFYIPEKLDWLIVPHRDVDWLDYDMTFSTVNTYIEEKRSPLIWVKYPDDRLKKCFITFW